MIVGFVFMDFVVQHVYTEKMLKKLMEVVVLVQDVYGI